MDPTPQTPPQSDPAPQSLSTLIALREQMQQLHAELEFLRLMLVLQKRQP